MNSEKGKDITLFQWLNVALLKQPFITWWFVISALPPPDRCAFSLKPRARPLLKSHLNFLNIFRTDSFQKLSFLAHCIWMFWKLRNINCQGPCRESLAVDQEVNIASVWGVNLLGVILNPRCLNHIYLVQYNNFPDT